MTERAIVAQRLLKRYGRVTALRDTSFAVTKGTITGFIGRNGAGKTTTLKIVATLMDADDGTCHVMGEDVRTRPFAIRHRIGFLPDLFELPATLTLREYLGIFTELYGVPRGDRARRVETTIQLTRTEELADRRLHALSRGEVQRVGLARALIHSPEVLLLDEPAAGLDPHARVELKELLRLLRERGKTVFLSSHVLADLEEICDELVVIKNGSVIFSGDIAGFRQQMRSTTRWRLTAVSRPVTLPSGFRGEVVETGPTWVEFEGEITPAERARWIAELVAKGIDVCEVAPLRSTLEQEFAKAVEEEEEAQKEEVAS
ncbi:MAG TPA: ABC transporter ATP-binding protein [Thermoanaerobaculia bacterium]|nr:ABC transporter ATP-binding protein [Thermoanaerobaculia bacterium]